MRKKHILRAVSALPALCFIFFFTMSGAYAWQDNGQHKTNVLTSNFYTDEPGSSAPGASSDASSDTGSDTSSDAIPDDNPDGIPDTGVDGGIWVWPFVMLASLSCCLLYIIPKYIKNC